ncbi:MAG: DUF2442 domain-containing protein [Rhodocyclaceae bacterium]|nr:DUF2442 domain-containing protein [Rhodocyclaceae bacterium]
MPSQTATQENSAAGVTPSAPWRVQAVSVLPGHRLAVTFRDGASGIADCSALLTATDAGIFGALADPEFFAKVTVELGVLTWPNGAELDPAWMHENIVAQKAWAVPF